MSIGHFSRTPPPALLGSETSVEFINEFTAADETSIANFEEDADLTTGSAPDVRISGTDLALWYEVQIPLKWNDLDSEAALIAWNRTDDNAAPELRIDLDGAHTPDRQLSFSLAMSDKSPLEDDLEWEKPDSIDFHIMLTDRAGRSASIALSSLQPLYPPIEVTTRKFALLDSVDPSEPVFQRYAIPTKGLQGIDPDNIATIRFRFDVTPAGALYLDDVAMARDPAPSASDR